MKPFITTINTLGKRGVAAIVLLAVLQLFGFPQLLISHPANATAGPVGIPDTDYANVVVDDPLPVVHGSAVVADVTPANYRTMWRNITAYSSTPDQTDSTPFIAADGSRVYDGMIAANFLPFGTRVYIPELFGNKEFVVHDRMHPRFQHTVDVWMSNRSDALKFGVQYAQIVIIEE